MTANMLTVLDCLETEDVQELEQTGWAVNVQGGDCVVFRDVYGNPVSASFRLLGGGALRLQCTHISAGKALTQDEWMPAFSRERFWGVLDDLVTRATPVSA
jgi:hypothetical protein